MIYIEKPIRMDGKWFLLDRDYLEEGQIVEDDANRSLLAMSLGKSADALDLFIEKWDEYRYLL